MESNDAAQKTATKQRRLEKFSRIYEVSKGRELRIELVENDTLVELTLVQNSGDAEVFGCELVPGKKYKLFGPKNISVFSFTGCRIDLVHFVNYVVDLDSNTNENEKNVDNADGNQDFVYVTEDSYAPYYLNIHHFLKQQREALSKNDGLKNGPTVVVCGPSDTGKSTLTKTLLNYAVRQGQSCMYVDLDVGQSSLCLPGSLAATVYNLPISPLLDDQYFYRSPICNREYALACCQPLVYFYGETSPSVNHEAYMHYCSELAEKTLKKINTNAKLKKNGCIVNTSGYVANRGVNCLEHIIKCFQADLVIVMGDDKLYAQLEHLETEKLTILKLVRPSGVIARSAVQRRTYRKNLIQSYFYGLDGNFSPGFIKMKFTDFKLYSFSKVSLPDSCLPFGFVKVDNNLQVRQIVPNSSVLVNHVVALLSLNEETNRATNDEKETTTTEKTWGLTEKDESDAILKANVIGFLCISRVNEIKKTVKFLCPLNRDNDVLPSNIMLLSDSVVFE